MDNIQKVYTRYDLAKKAAIALVSYAVIDNVPQASQYIHLAELIIENPSDCSLSPKECALLTKATKDIMAKLFEDVPVDALIPVVKVAHEYLVALELFTQNKIGDAGLFSLYQIELPKNLGL